MPIDDRTTNRSYKLPNAGNILADDVQRLRDALIAIDADVFARYTKTEIDQKLGDLINGAPGALNTLDELAAALGDDASFAATLTNLLSQKAASESPALTGTPTAPTAPVDTNTLQLATTAFVIAQAYLKAATAAATYAPLANPTFTGSPKLPSINGGQVAGIRNRIINGAMAVSQRKASEIQVFTAGAAIAYSVDRWFASCTGANITGERVNGATPGQFRYEFLGAASVTSINFGQRIEQFNSADLAGSTVTLSVDLANSLSLPVNWYVQYASVSDNFSDVITISSGSFAVNSVISRYSVQVSIPAAATTGIQVVFTVGAQTSGRWTIGDVQLELGNVATPFERLPVAATVSLCKRYGQWVPFNMLFYASIAGEYLETSLSWPEMRKVPIAGTLVADPNSVQANNNNAQNFIGRLTPYGGSSLLQASAGAASTYVTGYRSWLDAEL